MAMKKILFIDFCNYIDYQIGGHLSFARNLMCAFGNQLSLVGITTDKNDKTGEWIQKEIDGQVYDFFALARYEKTKTKHFIPDRIASLLLIRRFKKEILKRDFLNVFVQRPEVLIITKKFNYPNVCFCFPGTENPLKASRYWFGKYAADHFDKLFFSVLKDVKVILASADENAILEMVKRSDGVISRDRVIKFPTRINTDIFKPTDKKEARKKLGLSVEEKIIVTIGRLSWLKGWKLMIDSYILFRKSYPDSTFIFVGDGEDREKIVDYIAEKELTGRVIIAGKKDPEDISLFLSASDLFVMGSYKEGWSTSLIEAVACGTPVCVTNFSAASEIVREGVNGFIENDWNTDGFAELMLKAIDLEIKDIDVSRYSISRFKTDILKHWELF
jgi:glycosyltransferase involved in cell wall biosynthesis